MPMLICRQEFVVESFKCKESAKVKKNKKKCNSRSTQGSEVQIYFYYHAFTNIWTM